MHRKSPAVASSFTTVQDDGPYWKVWQLHAQGKIMQRRQVALAWVWSLSLSGINVRGIQIPLHAGHAPLNILAITDHMHMQPKLAHMHI